MPQIVYPLMLKFREGEEVVEKERLNFHLPSDIILLLV